MQKKWKPTNHTISDILEWSNENKLIIQPEFQRNAVWNETSKIMLIDTILKGYPIPKIFLKSVTENMKTVRVVIDGQQRITAILDFLNNKFSLEDPYEGPHHGKYFKDFIPNEQELILHYMLDCNEAYGYTEDEYREIYARLNKYTVPLNAQEIRKAEFPGNFFKLSEKIAVSEILDNWKIFTIAQRRRLLDVEYVSEILAALLQGPQEKKQTLDNFYRDYDKKNLLYLEEKFHKIISEIAYIFPNNELAKTRFKQKADFYSLVIAINYFVEQNLSLKGIDIKALRDDLYFIDQNVNPSDENDVKILQQYALRCIGSANTQASRSWRCNFLKLVFSGSYYQEKQFLDFLNSYREKENFAHFLDFYKSQSPLYYDTGFCSMGEEPCIECSDEIELDKNIWCLVWNRNTSYQRENLQIIHTTCITNQYIRVPFK